MVKIFFDEVVGKAEIFWFAKLCYKDIVSYHSVPKKWKKVQL